MSNTRDEIINEMPDAWARTAGQAYWYVTTVDGVPRVSLHFPRKLRWVITSERFRYSLERTTEQVMGKATVAIDAEEPEEV